MFGFVQANIADLSDNEKQRYKAVYCGLCKALQKRHGNLSRLSLSYDLTFLTLLLSSLYEPEEKSSTCRCFNHLVKKQPYISSECTSYAADITIVLTYFKCLDDWNDDGSLIKKWYASILSSEYDKVKKLWTRQCECIEKELKELEKLEADLVYDPDKTANCFGRLMAEIFVIKEDCFSEHLREIGFGLGRFIYLADAAIDLNSDIKKGNYNPLLNLSVDLESMQSLLKVVLGDVSDAFEKLPLVQDINILRNILYSGIWTKYNRTIQNERKRKE